MSHDVVSALVFGTACVAAWQAFTASWRHAVAAVVVGVVALALVALLGVPSMQVLWTLLIGAIICVHVGFAIWFLHKRDGFHVGANAVCIVAWLAAAVAARGGLQ